tara:strand:- start:18 stop:242 length:225 start_codon:yes stop_codon:yes gene_type:complete
LPDGKKTGQYLIECDKKWAEYNDLVLKGKAPPRISEPEIKTKAELHEYLIKESPSELIEKLDAARKRRARTLLL